LLVNSAELSIETRAGLLETLLSAFAQQFQPERRQPARVILSLQLNVTKQHAIATHTTRRTELCNGILSCFRTAHERKFSASRRTKHRFFFERRNLPKPGAVQKNIFVLHTFSFYKLMPFQVILTRSACSWRTECQSQNEDWDDLPSGKWESGGALRSRA
jgi:hypothetical protein